MLIKNLRGTVPRRKAKLPTGQAPQSCDLFGGNTKHRRSNWALMMPHIDSTKFGEIVIDGKKYGQVLIIGDAVFERNEEKLQELFGTTHQIGHWEIEQLLEGNPEVVIVGTGQEGVLKLEKDFFEQMKKARVEVITAITPKAIEIYNEKTEEGKWVNALIHTTC